MADLLIYMPNHGYSNDTCLYVSWLESYYYVSDKDDNSFKLATTSGGSTLVEYTEDITDGFVREESAPTPVTTISGLSHLEGEYVYLIANGRVVGSYLVSSGAITIPYGSYTQYLIGLPYTSTLQPMKLDLAGLGLATTKKPSRVVISLHETVRGKIGPDTNKLDPIRYRDAGGTGEEFPFFTGDREIPLAGGYSRQGDIVVRQDEPYPMTVLSLTLDVGASND